MQTFSETRHLVETPSMESDNKAYNNEPSTHTKATITSVIPEENIFVETITKQDPITVVIVNFNSGSLLSRCVQSVLSSTIPVDVIVVDNNSEDDSLTKTTALYQNDKSLTIVRNSHNTGFAHASNQALQYAKGKYWLFLNPDCIVKPDSLEKMKNIMDENPDVAMSGPLIVNPDGSEQRGCRRTIPTPWRSFVRAFGLSRFFQNHSKFKDFLMHKEPLPENPIDVEAISGAFMFVRSSVTKEVGLLDEGYFLHCEDLDWCMRFRQADWRILFVPNTVITHFKGGCSKNKQIFVLWHMHKGMIRFYRKFFKKRYPGALMWLVSMGVWFRFGVMSSYHLIKNTVTAIKSAKTKIHAIRTN